MVDGKLTDEELATMDEYCHKDDPLRHFSKAAAEIRELRVRDEAASLALEALTRRVVELEADNARLRAAMNEALDQGSPTDMANILVEAIHPPPAEPAEVS